MTNYASMGTLSPIHSSIHQAGRPQLHNVTSFLTTRTLVSDGQSPGQPI